MESSFTNLTTFLNKCRYKAENEEDKNKITHLSYGNFNGTFSIDKEQVKEFLSLYNEAIKNGNVLSILERQKKYGPLVIDIDLVIEEVETKNEIRLYNNKMIK